MNMELKRAYYTTEVDPPQRIFHNLRTIPSRAKNLWFLSDLSTDTKFVFLNAARGIRVIRTAAEGWTREDADTFHLWLMRHG
jgi:hypothetical protein